MTNIEINIACAEALGLTHGPLRDYAASLDACKELIAEAAKYGFEFSMSVLCDKSYAVFQSKTEMFDGTSEPETPELAICIAFLKWKGKWTE